MRDLVVFCADVGSVKSGNFGWARSEAEAASVAEHDTSSPADLAEAVVIELHHGLSASSAPCSFPCPRSTPRSEPHVAAKETGLGPLGPGAVL